MPSPEGVDLSRLRLLSRIERRLQRMPSTCIAHSVGPPKTISTWVVGVALLWLSGEHPTVAADESAHMTSAAAPHTCLAVMPGKIRPEFGCFKIGIAKNLKSSGPTVFWHLRTGAGA
jgi:hypothetical protein